MGEAVPLVIKGWTILVHPLFLDQIAALVEDIRRARLEDPIDFRKRNCAKRLAAIIHLAFESIPEDPSRHIYLQGDTLGEKYKHWLRAKFFKQYRLFFRFDRRSRIIIYAWVNDPDTKRAYGSRADAYAVFRGMLDSGNPPDDWAALKAACEAQTRRRTEGGGPSVADLPIRVRKEIE